MCFFSTSPSLSSPFPFCPWKNPTLTIYASFSLKKKRQNACGSCKDAKAKEVTAGDIWDRAIKAPRLFGVDFGDFGDFYGLCLVFLLRDLDVLLHLLIQTRYHKAYTLHTSRPSPASRQWQRHTSPENVLVAVENWQPHQVCKDAIHAFRCNACHCARWVFSNIWPLESLLPVTCFAYGAPGWANFVQRTLGLTFMQKSLATKDLW